MWNLHIDNILKWMGFRLPGDHGVYYKWDGANRVWLALYVDDIFSDQQEPGEYRGVEEDARGRHESA